MIWIPGVDEVPMSLSSIDVKEGVVGTTVEKVGEATSALHRMKVGDLIGLRGPFGRGYKVTKARNVMIAGGGTGLASLASLAEELVRKKNCRITFLLGAKTRGELLFVERMKAVLDNAYHRILVTTDDGSFGVKGLVTESAEHLLTKEKFDFIYACGPEPMMYKMFLLSERFNIPFQASLERLMRCAIGLCGTCVIGKYRVCKDGPVFSGEQLREVKDEFGHFKRSFDSRRWQLGIGVGYRTDEETLSKGEGKD
jgi:dihydroorotate dehydrogenase electron transfer subunit